MLNYILSNDLIPREYVSEYTNAGYLVREDYSFDPATGLFSGYDAAAGSYDKTTWNFQTDGDGVILKDRSLRDPQCVYQLLKTHYARYDLETVSSITGTPTELLQEVYEVGLADAGRS